MSRAQEHYDAVTEVWARWIMGDDLHFGFYESSTMILADATRALTEHLSAQADLRPELDVLDVGCGIGTAALELAERRACRVTGISTSKVGIDRARARARERGLESHARFVLADAMDNGLPAESFDRIFSLESTHLMTDKNALFSECHRVLRPGGKLALCDVCLVGQSNAEQTELMGYVMLGHSPAVAGRMRDAVHETMHRAFGSTKMTHFEVYREAARSAGFVDIQIEDISSATKRTLAHWGDNALLHADEIAALVGKAYLDDFFVALLHMSYGWGQRGGYITMTATKP